jgi:DeoR/GlpR family transcriptional regulator of sugar metabolism
MNRAFTQMTQSVNVMADASKFNSPAIFRICEMNRVTRVITDSRLASATCRKLEALGIEVLVAVAA